MVKGETTRRRRLLQVHALLMQLAEAPKTMVQLVERCPGAQPRRLLPQLAGIGWVDFDGQAWRLTAEGERALARSCEMSPDPTDEERAELYAGAPC